MKAKVLKCSRTKDCWYYNAIGLVFNCWKDNNYPGYVMVGCSEYWIAFIAEEDCVIYNG